VLCVSALLQAAHLLSLISKNCASHTVHTCATVLKTWTQVGICFRVPLRKAPCNHWELGVVVGRVVSF
jgi:hypothetical protein